MLQSFKDYCYHLYSVRQKAAWGKINLQGYVIQMLEDVLAALSVVPFLLTALKYLHKLVSFSVSFHFRSVFVSASLTSTLSIKRQSVWVHVCVFVYADVFFIHLCIQGLYLI